MCMLSLYKEHVTIEARMSHRAIEHFTNRFKRMKGGSLGDEEVSYSTKTQHLEKKMNI